MFTRAVLCDDASHSARAVDPQPFAVGFPVSGFVRYSLQPAIPKQETSYHPFVLLSPGAVVLLKGGGYLY
jgi:hypothetical protein